jgi:hypothetical protein
MCNLNQAELGGDKAKRLGREHNVTPHFTLQKLLQTANDANRIGNSGRSERFLQHVESLEKEYWEKNNIVPGMTDSAINLSFD